jgi:hypothetical protein
MSHPHYTIAPTRQEAGWKALAVVLPFLILFWINIAHHTLFFDEVNAWAISAASPNLSKLFYYVHYEGHPWLWYFILWFPSRLTHDPVALKWVEAAFGTAIIVVIGTLSPFTYKQRALILSGYFLVWEYTVMCRMYSVMLLLTLIYLWRRTRISDGLIANCALLGLIGNTDMTGVLLSAALLTEYAYTSYFGARQEERRAVVRRWIPAIAVYVALILFAVATLWPSKGISWQSSGHLGSQALSIRHIGQSATNLIASPWWPIAASFPATFWRTTPQVPLRFVPLIAVVLFVYWRAFRRARNLLILMATALVLGIAFADVVYVGNARNWGIVLVSFVAGLWMQAGQARSSGENPKWSGWTYGLLGLSTLAGVFAMVGSWSHPFSRARATAVWLKENAPANVAIVGEPDVSIASVAEEMARPVYFLECGCVDTFKLFARTRENFPETEMPMRLNRAMDDLHTQELLFVFYRPLNDQDTERLREANLTATHVRSFDGADMMTENYFIYQVTREAVANNP